MSTEVIAGAYRCGTNSACDLKSDLEREARLRKTSLSAVPTMAVRDWLRQSAANVEGDEGQRNLHEAASKCLGPSGTATHAVRSLTRSYAERKLSPSAPFPRVH
ncbi:MAG TPA: hypothetical protein VKJ01_00595 [Candidatus Solibacter sp.]|nr:hypothetical protein [Candidatus Solibacter sp.]